MNCNNYNKQVETLSQQVALLYALDGKYANSSRVRCFNCNKISHTQNKCLERSLSRRSQRGYSCGQIYYYARYCHQGNDQESSAGAGSRSLGQW